MLLSHDNKLKFLASMNVLGMVRGQSTASYSYIDMLQDSKQPSISLSWLSLTLVTFITIAVLIEI